MSTTGFFSEFDILFFSTFDGFVLWGVCDPTATCVAGGGGGAEALSDGAGWPDWLDCEAHDAKQNAKKRSEKIDKAALIFISASIHHTGAGTLVLLTKADCMKLFTADQMRDLDAAAIRDFRIPAILMMEHAGLETARAVESTLGNLRGKKVAVVCGPGNNGGDGFAAARILNDLGARVEVFLAGDAGKLKGDPQTNFEPLAKLRLKVLNPSRNQDYFRETLSKSDCIVDALFGTGLKRPIEGDAAAVVQAMNEAGPPIVSIDLPSGVDADNGKVLGVAVKATATVTLAAYKVGLWLYPARELAGKITVAYISLPEILMEQCPCVIMLAGKETVASWLPKWKVDIHKGKRGTLMIVGGSRGFTGAPSLSALAAGESGAGMIYLAVPEGIMNVIEQKLTDPVKVGLPQTDQGCAGPASLPRLKELFGKTRALAVGPGIGIGPETGQLVKALIDEFEGPMVIDADGLYHLDDEFLKSHGKPSLILTPHEGEMGRMCGITPGDVREDRLKLAREKACAWNVTLVLKGASTIVAAPDGIWINPTGNPGMAAGGSGDVLTGVTASMLAQGMEPLKAAVAAVFLHGLAGDLCARAQGMRSVTASKLVQYLPEAIKSLDSSDRKSLRRGVMDDVSRDET